MSDSADKPDNADKVAKKLGKARVKAAKKLAKTQQPLPAAAERAGEDAPSSANAATQLKLAERSARAAEQKVRLERWRVVVATIGVLIGLATLLFMLRTGC